MCVRFHEPFSWKTFTCDFREEVDDSKRKSLPTHFGSAAAGTSRCHQARRAAAAARTAPTHPPPPCAAAMNMTILYLVRVLEREVRPPYSHVITSSLGIIAARARARARVLAPALCRRPPRDMVFVRVSVFGCVRCTVAA